MDALSTFVNNVTRLILTPIIALLFALALYYFVFGMVLYIAKSDQPEMRSKGTRMLFWGVIGFFIMVGVIGILSAALGTFHQTLPR
jgi:uncharacterized membrane protein YfcA